MHGRRYTVVSSNHSAAPSRGLFKCDGCYPPSPGVKGRPGHRRDGLMR
jgi:hypothetical protein